MLGLPSSASDADVKRVYRELSLQLHPDKNPGQSQEDAERFTRINQARPPPPPPPPPRPPPPACCPPRRASALAPGFRARLSILAARWLPSPEPLALV